MMKSKIGMGSLLIAVALVTACNSTSNGVDPNANREPNGASLAAANALSTESSPKRAPAVLEVRGPSQVTAHSEFDVEVVLTRRVAMNQPVALTIALPPGVVLVDGTLSETIDDPSVGAISRKVRVRIGDIPQQDIVAHADGRGAAAGYHSKGAWSFGRPAAKLIPPTTSTKPLVVRGRNLGRPIVMH